MWVLGGAPKAAEQAQTSYQVAQANYQATRAQLEQSRAGVHAVVETRPAVVEEDVAAHLPREGRVLFLDLLLDQDAVFVRQELDDLPAEEKESPIDLLSLDVGMTDTIRNLLPADGTADGFDRIAAALLSRGVS